MSGLEILSLILGIPGPLEQSINHIRTIKHHYQSYKTNPQAIDYILEHLIQHHTDLRRLKDQLDENQNYIPNANQQFIDRTLNRIKQVLENISREIQEIHKNINKSKVIQLLKAKSISTTCESIKQQLNNNITAFESVNAVMTTISSNLLVTTEQTGHMQAIMCNRQDQIISNINRVSIASGSNLLSRDQYKRQQQPLEYTSAAKLNFKDIENKPITVEAKIKHELLHPSQNAQAIIAIQGEAGVGKTTTLALLTREADVQKHFADGIYCMKFRADITNKTIIQQIIKIVNVSGGQHVSEAMKQIDNINEIIGKACDWFRDRQILLAVDDIWYNDGRGVDVLKLLSKIILCGKSAAMVYTTRDGKVALQGKVFRIERSTDPLSSKCRSILMRHARCSEDATYDMKTEEAIEYLLKICAGLPAAHGVVGKAVAEYSLSSATGMEVAWIWYRNTHGSIIEGRGDTYGDLQSIFMTALKVLEKDLSGEKKLESNSKRGNNEYHCLFNYSYYQLHRALCVLEKQQRAPLSMLACLWAINGKDKKDTKNEEIVRKICERFVRVGLAEWNHIQIHDNSANHESDESNMMECISIHDLLHDFAENEATKKGELNEWHNRLIEGYERKYELPTNDKDKCREWWRIKGEETSNDRSDYLLKNLSRHMRMCGKRRNEIITLVTRPLWIATQVCTNGIVQYDRDVEYAIDFMKTNEKKGIESEKGVSNENEDHILSTTDLRWIHEAVRLSAHYIQRHDREIWFQLYDRLMDQARESTLLKKYLSYIEENAPRPWLRPLKPCLSGVGKNSISVGTPIRSMVVLKSKKEVACGCDNANIVIVNIRKKYIETQWRAHDKEINHLHLSEDGKYLVSGSADNTAKVWETQSFRLICTLAGHRTFVTSVWIGNQGKIAFTGDYNGIVYKWNATNGEQIGKEFRTDGKKIRGITVLEDEELVLCHSVMGKIYNWRIKCTEDKVKKRLVLPRPPGQRPLETLAIEKTIAAITTTKDGEHLAIGSDEEGIAVWNTSTMTQTCMINIGGQNAFEFRMTFNRKGTRLASFFESGVIVIYDVRRGKIICEPLTDHLNEVTGVEFITGKDELVSCSLDGTVRSWNLGDIPSQSPRSEQPFQDYRCCVTTPEGSNFITGHDDGKIRVWEVETSRLSQLKQADNMNIVDLTISPDGKRIFYASSSGTIRVIDRSTLERIASFEGHQDSVPCIDITSDGNHLVTGSWDKTIRIWDTRRCNGFHNIIRTEYRIYQLFVSDDGKRIVSKSSDHKLRLWDMESKRCIREIQLGMFRIPREEAMIVMGEYKTDEHNNAKKVFFDLFTRKIRYGSPQDFIVLGTLESIFENWKFDERNQILCFFSELNYMEHPVFLKIETENVQPT